MMPLANRSSSQNRQLIGTMNAPPKAGRFRCRPSTTPGESFIMALKLLLFDIDGTLLITNGVGREAKARAMVEVFGTDAGIRDMPFGGKTDWQLLAEALAPHGYTVATLAEHITNYETLFARHMAEIISDFPTTILPGAAELVARLRQREDVLLGIVTGNTALTAPIKLQAGGFDPAWFPVGAYGSESADRNDLPVLALKRALDHSKLPIANEDVWIIGDTVRDVLAARAIGGKAVAVLTGFEDYDELIASQPDYVLNDLTEFDEKVAL
jgi:phosphoglycolate phosphatase-like HAD superfamily hydrolase